MKSILFTLFVVFFAFTNVAQAQETFNLQIIHNSADPAVANVDIYVNDLSTPFLSSVPFRGATGFVELDANATYDITVTPAGAAPEAGFSFNGLTFDAGENYIVIATGVADPTSFAPNPNGIDTGFFLDVIVGASLEADDPETVEFLIYHGATDAPAVDVIARNVATLAEDVEYTDVTPNYLAVPAASYILDINVAGTSTTAASFEADLSGLAGGTAIVLASGFLSPAENNDGPAFGLIAVLTDGTVVEIPAAEEVTTFNLQIIHNSADPAVASVDIYVNDLSTPFLSSVPFRGATGFVELDANATYDITVTPAGAAPEAGFSFNGLTFDAGENYIVIATGVADPTSFAPNPNGIDTGFFLDVIVGASLVADDPETVEFLIYHGATDAPAVDVIARNVATLAEDVEYTDVTPNYLAVPAASYILDINVAGTSTTAASFEADLSGLAGGTAIVLASGFLSPAENNNGPAFGLIAVLTDGTVVEIGVFTSIGEDVQNPIGFTLEQNYPNPFNPTTNIRYTLAESVDVRLEVFNLLGQRVATLVDASQNAGTYQVTFDARSLSSGIYLYRIQAGSFVQTQRMTLVK